MSNNWQPIGAAALPVKEWTELCYALRAVVEPHVVEDGNAILVLEALACATAYVVSLIHPRHHDRLAALLEDLPDKSCATRPRRERLSAVPTSVTTT